MKRRRRGTHAPPDGLLPGTPPERNISHYQARNEARWKAASDMANLLVPSGTVVGTFVLWVLAGLDVLEFTVGEFALISTPLTVMGLSATREFWERRAKG